MRNFKDELNELKTGSKQKIMVSSEEFMDFRNAWLQDPEHEKIIGKAQKHGEVIYYYDNEK